MSENLVTNAASRSATAMTGRAARVLLGVSGCVAAYKAAEVLRSLQKAGCEVRVVITEHGERFVGRATFDALADGPTLTDLFDYPETPIAHVELTAWADLLIVCPTTGNVLAKAAHGIADDALTSCILAADGPVLYAPAMNTRMWANPATQDNVATLRARGAHFVEPDAGRLACGDVGEGKLAPVDEIVAAALGLLEGEILRLRACGAPLRMTQGNTCGAPLRMTQGDACGASGAEGSGPSVGPLSGRRVLVTAGPTHEAIDAVRYIANASSGKMGYALAEAARDSGAEVVLVSGPVALTAPDGVTRIDVTSAAEMHARALELAANCDVCICAAAVADYTPAAPADHKLKKGVEELESIALVRTPDILAELSASKAPGQVVVGFAAETDDLIANAQAKLSRKGCDLIVANDVSRADSTFGADTDRVSLVSDSGVEELPTLAKPEVARRIIARVAELLGA